MLTKKIVSMMLIAFIAIEVISIAYALIKRQQMENFNCSATLSQHYRSGNYSLSINYMIRGKFGLVHISGFSDSEPLKIFNRKISFKLQRKSDIFYMMADKNIKLPDDNFDDAELSQIVPRFFVTPGKEIYMRILKQKNNNFVFMVDSIPTYVCNTFSRGS